ncbi:MAG: hypothetical protein V1777_03480 [Candidatus Micrarchaeota archaeon]
MGPLTLALLVLIVLLVMGIVALNRLKPVKPQVRQSIALSDFVVSSAIAKDEQTVFFQSKIAMLDKKTELLQGRLVRIENIVAALPVDRLKKEFDVSKLEAKVERLVESRDELRIEVEALNKKMESLERLNSAAQKIGGREKQTQSFEERLHALAFNRRSMPKKK